MLAALTLTACGDDPATEAEAPEQPLHTLSEEELSSDFDMADPKATAGPPACEGETAAFVYGEPPVFSGWGLTPASTHAIPSETAGIDADNV